MLTVALFVLLAQNQEQVWIGTVYPETHPPIVRDRVEFTKRFDRIEEGMTMSQVRSILGPPDDVLMEGEKEQLYADSSDTWKYGSISKLSFSAYGEVRFFRGRSIEISGYGRKGGTWHDEERLLEVLLAIGEPSKLLIFFGSQDLGLSIRAANLLIDMGAEGARVALAEHGRLVSLSRRLPISNGSAVHMLFEPRSGVLDGLTKVVGGVPLPVSTVEGRVYGRTGPGPDFARIADEYFKTHRFRTEPYRPDDDPSELIEFVKTLIGDGRYAQTLYGWMVSLFSRVVEPPGNLAARPYIGENLLTEYLDEVGSQDVKWDEELYQYVPRDGHPLPAKRHELHRTFLWMPGSLEKHGLQISLQRSTRDLTSVSVRRELTRRRKFDAMPELVVYVFDVDEDDRLLAYFSSHSEGWRPPESLAGDEDFVANYREPSPYRSLSMPQWSYREESRDGFIRGQNVGRTDPGVTSAFEGTLIDVGDRAIRLRLEIDGKTFVSPILRP